MCAFWNWNQVLLKLRAFLGDKMAKYKIPRTIKFVETLPYTPSGKIMKYKLREEYAK